MGGSSDRRQSRDGSESIEASISWPVIGNPLPRGDGKDIVPGDWVDKVMINKCDPRSGDNFQGRLQNETGRPPKISNPKYTPNPSKKYPAKSQDTRKVANSQECKGQLLASGRKKTNNSK
ncbi:hypothetical protein Leryth_021022 [Lithospermum erythrorhizon]|nr:hypothetical protein Leryth_021022 [Lithospermum erythrorhizon]